MKNLREEILKSKLDIAMSDLTALQIDLELQKMAGSGCSVADVCVSANILTLEKLVANINKLLLAEEAKNEK